MKTKKELKAAYKSMKFKAGIYQILNKKDNRRYLQSTMDLDRGFNADLFQLNARMHANAGLQKDWNELGPENFEITAVDELKIDETSTPAEINRDLKELLEMHRTELKDKGRLLYE